MRGRVIAMVAVAALVIGACGDDGGDAALVPAIPADTPTQTTPAPTTTTTGTPFKVGSIKVSQDTSKKPTITKPSGDPPPELVTKDVVTGNGTAVKAGDGLEVQYLGALFDGEQFEASWDAPGRKPFPFTLGQGNVIAGWDQGIEGMKPGGRRLLVIPPDLAYAEAGQGNIPPGATLVFVVDLLKRTAG
ncbi:MAG: FKBP-type peptidyl-prolyl cis-trans isomerase [Actinomycetota bacterium]|nr:FKBP-type peptidyl-prolyl cis-trans isomerase [Actinomycetota bacterium]